MNQTRKYVLEVVIGNINIWIKNYEGMLPTQLNNEFREKMVTMILEFNIMKDELQVKLDEETNDSIRDLGNKEGNWRL